MEQFDEKMATQQALSHVPPIDLLTLAKTEDQKQWMAEIVNHYSLVRAALESYFSGRSVSTYSDAAEKRRVESEVSHLLSIYNLAWFGWDEIKSELKTLGDAAVEFPGQPGELLTFYLELECEAMAVACLNDGTVSAYESRQILTSGLPASSEAVGAMKKRNDRTMVYADEVMQRSGHAARLLDFLERAVKKRLRGNSQLRGHLIQFQKTRKERIRLTKQALKGARGVKWVDGSKILA